MLKPSSAVWPTVAVLSGLASFGQISAKAQQSNQQPSNQQPTQPLCDPIGRIAEGSSQNYQQGQVVCSGSEIIEPASVQFLCFTNATFIPLTGDRVEVTAETCSSESVSTHPEIRTCNRTGLSRLWCFIPKGPEEQFQVLQPEVSSTPQPTIAWEAVPDIASYTVHLLGADVTWERTVASTTTELTYPTDEAPLQLGFAYEVIITANDDSDEIAAAASRVINISRTAQTSSLQRPTRTNGAQ
ncbi:MAG: hypothetical protein AAGE59_21970 [Cyanobacteria bacterium P01_F01_bin.86]